MVTVKKHTRNKWWRLMKGTTYGLQWESRNHPDFLFIAVRRNLVVRRVGNALFDLINTTPEVLYHGTDKSDAEAFARKWVKRHSDRLR